MVPVKIEQLDHPRIERTQCSNWKCSEQTIHKILWAAHQQFILAKHWSFNLLLLGIWVHVIWWGRKPNPCHPEIATKSRSKHVIKRQGKFKGTPQLVANQKTFNFQTWNDLKTQIANTQEGIYWRKTSTHGRPEGQHVIKLKNASYPCLIHDLSQVGGGMLLFAD